MASVKQLRYYWGVLLPALCEGLGVPKDRHVEITETLHKAFKEYFSLKSISSLNIHKTEIVFSRIRMLMARERGILLPLPNDPPMKILEAMPMEMFLKLYQEDDKKQQPQKRSENQTEIRDFVCAMYGIQSIPGKME